MNEIIEAPAPETELNSVQSDRASSLALITSDGNMDRVMKMAKLMAGSKVTIPKHLQGSDGDCAAIVIQATNWGMNPFAVAQKTHLVNGVLGYEAQLVNAVIQSSNSIRGSFSYEYQGDGDRMSCRVGAVLRGQTEITWGEWLKSSDVTTKNSPLWKTNPKQQIGYLQVKNWARLYCPGAILGVYTADELEELPPQPERDVTPQPAQEKELVYYTNDEFGEKKSAWKEIVLTAKKTGSDLITFVESKGKLLTEAQKTEINSWKVIEQAPVDDPFVTDMQNAEQQGEQ